MKTWILSSICVVSGMLLCSCAPRGPVGHTAPIAVLTPGEPGRISPDGTTIYYDPKVGGPDQLERLLREALERQEKLSH